MKTNVHMVLFILLNLFDMLTTQSMIGRGLAQEANPVPAMILDAYGFSGLWTMKLLATPLLVWLAMAMEGESKYYALLTWNCMLGAVVLWNTILMRLA